MEPALLSHSEIFQQDQELDLQSDTEPWQQDRHDLPAARAVRRGVSPLLNGDSGSTVTLIASFPNHYNLPPRGGWIRGFRLVVIVSTPGLRRLMFG